MEAAQDDDAEETPVPVLLAQARSTKKEILKLGEKLVQSDARPSWLQLTHSASTQLNNIADMKAQRGELVARLRLDVEALSSSVARLGAQSKEHGASFNFFRCCRRQSDPALALKRAHLSDEVRDLRQFVEGNLDSKPGQGQPLLEEIAQATRPWNFMLELIRRRSEPHMEHYGYTMNIKKIWRIPTNATLQQFEEQAWTLGEPAHLFHGTSVENAANIVAHGFRVPRDGEQCGMMGRGIYFAECPLKSVNFTRKEDPISRIFRWVRGEATSEVGGLQMLLCDVYLGRSKTLRSAQPSLDPSVEFKAGALSQFFGFGDYNSVLVPGGVFSPVNVAEYVVFESYQAIPRYLIEFKRRKK